MADAPAPLANRDIASYAALAPDAVPGVALEGALLDALAAAFVALGDPQCARLVGPIVPGATLARGARVPGTSLELDPVAAAFGLGIAVGWHGGRTPVRENLGALFALLDYRARRADELGHPAPTIGVLLASLDRAARIQAALEAEPGYPEAAGTVRLAVRVASAAIAAQLLGGGIGAIAAAATYAWRDGVPPPHPRAPPVAPRRALAGGEASSRGLRCALWALATAETEARGETDVAADRAATAARARFVAAAPPTVDPDAALARFATSLEPWFSERRRAAILSCVSERETFVAMPVHAFVAQLVRND